MNKKLSQVRNGLDSGTLGGANLESQYAFNERHILDGDFLSSAEPGSDSKKFLDYFIEEIKEQIRGGPMPKK